MNDDQDQDDDNENDNNDGDGCTSFLVPILNSDKSLGADKDVSPFLELS